MKVKRYNGSSLEKIRDVIIKELGENAVIINIQKKKGSAASFLGVGSQASFEVVAAVEDTINVDKLSLEDLNEDKAVKELLSNQKEHYRGLRQSMKLIDEKLAEVDERMEDMIVRGNNDEPNDQLRNVHAQWRPQVSEAAQRIAKTTTPTPEDWHEALASLVPTAGGIMFRRKPSSSPDVYVLIGPTGVGKTTTLAKLAAKCVLSEKLNVGLITLDTFRVAALDQLREYANLLGVELAVSFSTQELKHQLDRFSDKDVVFIDTPGRSQFDSMGLKNIQDILQGIEQISALIAVPANIRSEDAKSIYEKYRTLRPSAIIITKTDEATSCDGITTLLDVSALPILYLTDGQRVPEDIHAASPGIVASMVMPSVKCSEQIKIGDQDGESH